MANVIKPLSFWVQKVLPLVYDDSLSYYEVLEKCVWKLNELIEQTNNDRERMQELVDAAVAEAVNTKVPDIVFQKLQELIGTGVLYNMIESIATLETQNYLAQMLDTTVIDYLETVDRVPILTVQGEYIFVSKEGKAPTSFTTNPISYFYKYRQDAENKVLAGKKPRNTAFNEYLLQPMVLTLLHYSDYHGDNQELDWIYGDWATVVAQCDDYICTGDLVFERFHDRFDYFANTSYMAAKRTLLTIGNHDAYYLDSGYDGTQIATEQELFDKYFAPTIQYWGVQYQEGKTYYYKDYNNQHIRLVVIDDMLLGADAYAQQIWLQNTALQTDFSVVIARHFRSANSTNIVCPFTSMDWIATTGGGGNVSYVESEVQSFINRGGKFICYICGHTHYDMVSYSNDYPNQISIAIDAASREQCNAWSDVMRYDNQISRDLFNVVQFDTSNHVVKLIRCGCNYDNRVREKNTFCIDYLTKEIIYQ